MTNRNLSKSREALRTLVGVAVFSALAYGVTFVFRIPVGFLTFDANDAVIVIASFLYGPLAALAMSGVTALLEMITVSATGPWGALMNFISSAAFSVCASAIYRVRRDLVGAVAGLYSAVALTSAVMMPTNLLITPIYTGASSADVLALIPKLLLPFNLAKALLNSAIAMFLYKPVSLALRRAGLTKSAPVRRKNASGAENPAADLSAMRTSRKRQTILMLAVGAVTLAAAVLIFVFLKR